MKSQLYAITDISDIIGKSKDRIYSAVTELGLLAIQRESPRYKTKDFYSESQLKQIKHFFKENNSNKYIRVPEDEFEIMYEPNSNEVLMCNSFGNPDTVWYIFRSINEQVEICLTPKDEIISTHYLKPQECNYIKRNYPQINFIEYRIRGKIFT